MIFKKQELGQGGVQMGVEQRLRWGDHLEGRGKYNLSSDSEVHSWMGLDLREKALHCHHGIKLVFTHSSCVFRWGAGWGNHSWFICFCTFHIRGHRPRESQNFYLRCKFYCKIFKTKKQEDIYGSGPSYSRYLVWEVKHFSPYSSVAWFRFFLISLSSNTTI